MALRPGNEAKATVVAELCLKGLCSMSILDHVYTVVDNSRF